MASVTPAANYAEGMKETPLLELESNPMMLYGEGISTVQFYECRAGSTAENAQEYLRSRLNEVVRDNLWVASSLFKDVKKYGKLTAMRYNTQEPPIDKSLR